LQTVENGLHRWHDISVLVDGLPSIRFTAKDVSDAQLKGDRLSSDRSLHSIGADYIGQVRADSDQGIYEGDLAA
jgi:hypothetical protein